ncbi:hypothetical protein H5P28_10260 [Ruficoccus amylovorans]|uniref:Uncharacterized protein n=2 Tax=Ruficoccus amylovorans TaxID=1804625 RepID=A0A842HDX8_9BACT|nr:hypothetical protein [Ruficoccus amylovorans]MBC2594642.1 hypothetical protein [Ruficoccus amylovorans]
MILPLMRNGLKTSYDRLLPCLRLGFLLLLTGVSLEAARQHPESYYQDRAAVLLHGQTEISLPNGTRCDILTDEYAIEVDFADKWAEAIGQSLNCAAQTGRRAAIILIIEKPSHQKYLQRLEGVIESHALPIVVLPYRQGHCFPCDNP